MKYLLWLYLANISNRFRWFAATTFRLSLIALAIEHLALATHIKPVYYEHVMHIVNLTWLLALFAWFVMLLPSAKYITNVLTIARRDDFMRNSLLAKILRLIKYIVKHDLFDKKYSRGLYQRIVTPKRIKWLYIGLYLYDLYKVYSRALGDLVYLVVAYFAFVCASWLYVDLTGSNLYYYSSIVTSFNWGLAIVGFLIFKVIFLPDFGTLKNAAIKIAISAALHKFGIIKAGYKLDEKLASYEPVKKEQDNA
ncbi:MAG: hypothetical protein K2Y14_08005 [Burkholderiales bacterium]|nr:hypothetical protein [Burkholderiales bacterium]